MYGQKFILFQVHFNFDVYALLCHVSCMHQRFHMKTKVKDYLRKVKTVHTRVLRNKTSHQQTIYLLKKYFRINAFWYLGYNDALTTIREERR